MPPLVMSKTDVINLISRVNLWWRQGIILFYFLILLFFYGMHSLINCSYNSLLGWRFNWHTLILTVIWILWFNCLYISSSWHFRFLAVDFVGYFLTKIFHPNIATNGEICVNTLKKDWNPSLGLRHVLIVGSILAV